MKRYTLFIILSILILPFTARAAIFGPYTTVHSGPYAIFSNGFLNVSGQLNDMVIWASYDGNLSDTVGFQAYRNDTNPAQALDCYTEKKSASAWGLNNDTPVLTDFKFSGTDCNIVDGVLIKADPYGLHTMAWGDYSSGAQFAMFFTDADIADPYMLTNTTEIISTSPFNMETIATSTAATIEINYNITKNDFDKGNNYIYVRYVLNSDLQAAVASPDLLYTQIKQKIFSYGLNTFSTTTPIIRAGTYTLESKIIHESAATWWAEVFALQGVFNVGNLTGTTTQFIASTTSNYDNWINEALSSNVLDLDKCRITNLDLTTCAFQLLGWQGAAMQDEYTKFTDAMTHAWPIGYGIRFADIIMSTATSTLASPSYTFPNDFPVSWLAGITMSFNFPQILASADTILKTNLSSGADPKNVWDILLPIVKIVFAIQLIMMMINDLTHFHAATGYPSYNKK